MHMPIDVFLLSPFSTPSSPWIFSTPPKFSPVATAKRKAKKKKRELKILLKVFKEYQMP